MAGIVFVLGSQTHGNAQGRRKSERLRHTKRREKDEAQ